METLKTKRRKKAVKVANQFFAFTTGENVVLFKIGINWNRKIAPIGERILTTYTFSVEQWNYSPKNLGDFNFFNMDRSNCLGCKYSSSGSEKCYTHKFHSLAGFVKTIKAAKQVLPNVLPTFNNFESSGLISSAKGLYIRFGAYGEPIFIPVNLVKELTSVCKSWTGYTHVWHFYPDYMPYFMASTDSMKEYTTAKKIGWRCFHVISEYSFIPAKSILCPKTDSEILTRSTCNPFIPAKSILCPETDSEILTCSTCNLCSGLNVAAKDILMPKH